LQHEFLLHPTNCTLLYIALYPGLLTPAFVSCCTRVGEGLVKLITWNGIPGHWVDVWRSGTFLLYSCKAAFWTQETSPGLSDVECSVVYSLCLQSVVHSLTCSFLGMCHSSTRPPNVQVCHCMWSVLPGLPPALVLQVTNTGVRRPGY